MRLEVNKAELLRFRSSPGCTEVSLQLSDEEVGAMYRGGARALQGIYREGRQFRLFSGASAEWKGGGWWRIAGTRHELTTTIARLYSIWNPPPQQGRLDLRIERQLPGKEKVSQYLKQCHEILKGN